VLNNGNSEMTNEMIERIMREEIQKRLDMYFEGSSNVLEQIKSEEVQAAQPVVKSKTSVRRRKKNTRAIRTVGNKYAQLLDIPLNGTLFVNCPSGSLTAAQRTWASYAFRVGKNNSRKFVTRQTYAKDGIDIIRVA